jgi:threonylcarbamoyladenosine tRNA methylthiotransferase MtaB
VTKVYLRTYGCRANHYDSEAVRALVESAGGSIVASPQDADVAVFNSCAVTADAVADLRKGVRRAARLRPGLRSVVREIRALPGVERVVASGAAEEVAAALGLAPATAPAGGRGSIAQSTVRAVLRIQDGCDEHCTFCITTLARGASRSRPPAELVAEAAALAERHPEIVLTGIHIGGYGAELGTSLGALVTRLVREVPAARLRLSSIEATEVDDELLAHLRGDPGRVVPHLHAPLQSGSDAVLKRMGRHWYSAHRYAEAVERVVGARPVFGLGADVIAGFPGETEADHRATLELVERLPFTYLHVFPFSLRPGTAAERLPGRVDDGTIARRAAELRETAARKAAAYRASRAGGEADVVVVAAGGKREGLTEDYLTVLPADALLPRRSRVRARLSVDGEALVAHAMP